VTESQFDEWVRPERMIWCQCEVAGDANGKAHQLRVVVAMGKALFYCQLDPHLWSRNTHLIKNCAAPAAEVKVVLMRSIKCF
jgi:hypothetical protein